MRVEVVHIGGRYSERVFTHLSSVSPGNVDAYQVPRSLPPVLDDAAEYLPAELGAGDVIIAINIHPELLLEIPNMVGGGSTQALIAPIEDPNWVKPGLQRQVTQACAANEMESAFPKPFCSLDPSTPAITEFCEQFKVGRPKFKLRVRDGKVAGVEVVRGSPCGLTHFVGGKLVGLPADDSLPEKAGQLHHGYPCLASMNLDPATGETVMHASLYLLRDVVKEALEEARKAG
ncbi:MAG: hypothetical protein JSV79_12250 [Armatimonadota bacterium]|nr:MAG: hypothetical protein JSV79_12250 [Armatimonadota bacterium]